jgi:hypothetical protein
MVPDSRIVGKVTVCSQLTPKLPIRPRCFSFNFPTRSASTSFVFRCTGPRAFAASLLVHSFFQNCYGSSMSISLAV